MFGALQAAGEPSNPLRDIAADFTPRFETCGPRTVVLDLSGLARLFGHPQAIGRELQRAAAERGVRACIAIAGTATAARLLVGWRVQKAPPYTDVIVVEPHAEADAVAPLPLALLADIANENDPNDPNGPNDPNDLLTTFRRWGLRTLGDLAALPADEVAARLGVDGVRWHRLARGHDRRPLRPEVPPERFEQALDLEWPIEGLEPLSFVLGRLLEPLAAHLERRGRGAAVLHVRLHLVTRAVHERSLELPAPMRDARTFRTLLLLDLESHPPQAGIDRVAVAVDPTPARVLQFSLLTRPLPSPEQLSTLNARLAALMGEDRCGSPVVVDTWKPGAFGMRPFVPNDHVKSQIPTPKSQLGTPHSQMPAVALRRFRHPIPARVRVEQGRPLRVTTDRVARRPAQPVLAKRSAFADRLGLSGGRVDGCAGPWRTSGNWWVEGSWDRDEWDVTLSDGATYRIFHDRSTAAWFVEGVYD